MKNLLITVVALGTAMLCGAQNTNYGQLPQGDWYPGYNKSSQSTVQNSGKASKKGSAATKNGSAASKGYAGGAKSARYVLDTSTLPDHFNNADYRYFPPIFSQGSFGSCGVTSHVGYMLTSEMNAVHNTDASLEENQLCPMFEYIFTYHGPGKDEMGLYVGYPTADVYGGRYPGSKYGGYEYESGVAGWMQGYDSWYNAMLHRIGSCENFNDGNGHKYSTNPDGDGIDMIKGYLYNHLGDPTYGGRGGIFCMGVGIARSERAKVPTTPTNSQYGFAGKEYMLHWNLDHGDHAMTIVGYDDRIQFDLDGNGIVGETNNRLGQNENGAWIIANTWGEWANAGFVYCPYAMGGGVSTATTLPAPTSSAVKVYKEYADGTSNADSVSYSSTNKVTVYKPNWFWEPYMYHYRADYKPTRTMKVKMEYIHRSEISVVAGIAGDTTATRPEKTFTFSYINYTGDGSGTNPATPLLGQWADGTMHYEPMEFGIDLTDLTDGYDTSKPLKYFLIINSSSDAGKAQGEGQIISASVIDYEFDDQGIETPFADKNVQIQNGGKQTKIATVVRGEQFNAPLNLAFTDGTLSWDAPARGIYTPDKYYIYKDGELTDSTTYNTNSKAIADTEGTWTVKSVYLLNNKVFLSAASNNAVPSAAHSKEEAYDDDAISVNNGGFYVPDVADATHAQYTVEFWFRPSKLQSNGDRLFYSSWGSKYRMYAEANGSIVAGWANMVSNNARIATPANTLKNGQWAHIALVIDGKKHTIYVNGNQAASATTVSNNSGFPSYWKNRLYFGDGASLNGKIDELRLWTTARTAEQIQNNYRTPIVNPKEADGLVAYFKGDMYEEEYSDDNGLEQTRWRIKDYAQGHDAFIVDESTALTQDTVKGYATITPSASITPTVSISGPQTAYMGEAVAFSANGSVGLTGYNWTATVSEGQEKTATVSKPSFVFTSNGTHNISVTATDISGRTATASTTIEIVDITPTSDFILSADTVNTGQTISFISRNQAPGCSYTWTWDKDANGRTTSNMTNASTIYEDEGTHTVSLTVTGSDGKTYTTTKTFVVTLVEPVEGYQISPTTVMKGEMITLTDKSTNQPTTGQWSFLSPNSFFRMDGLSGQVAPAHSGVYALTHTVGNRVGEVSNTYNNALIVCNAESRYGLNFYGANNQTMTFSLPTTPAIARAWTIDFWAKAEELSASCLTIKAQGTSANNALSLVANAVGNVTLSTRNKTATLEGVYSQGLWHHYAFCANGTTITVYADGSKVGTLTSSQGNYSSILKDITIGGDNSRFSIDELRVWNKALSENDILEYANQPLTKEQISDLANNLLVYYNFNLYNSETQFADSTANAVNATLTGFDQTYAFLSESKGVFSLDLNTAENEELVGEELPRTRFKVVDYSDSAPNDGDPSYVIDGNQDTHWHSQWKSGNYTYIGYPHYITLSRLGHDSIQSIQIYYKDRNNNYRTSSVTVEESDDNTNWTVLDKNHHLFSFASQNMVLQQAATKKYIRLTFNTGYGSYLCIKELRFYGNLHAVKDLESATNVYTIAYTSASKGGLYERPFGNGRLSVAGATPNADVALSESDPYQQWAFIKGDTATYLYNVGSHKFANGTTMAKGEATPVSITTNASGHVSITVGTTTYQSVSIVEAPEYVFTDGDRAQAVRQLSNADQISDHNVTFRIVLGDTTYAQQSESVVNGAWIPGNVTPTGMASYKNDFVVFDITPKPVHSDTTVVATYNGPIQFSQSFADAVWYRLEFTSSDNLAIAYNPNHKSGTYTDNSKSLSAYDLVGNEWDKSADNSLWAFTGSPYAMRIWNKGAGSAWELHLNSNAGGGAVMEKKALNANTGVWAMNKSGDGISINNVGKSSSNTYLYNRALSNSQQGLGVWTGAAARQNANARIQATLMEYEPDVFQSLPTQSNTRWGEYIVEGKKNVDLDDLIAKYEDNPSATTFKAVINGINNYNFGSAISGTSFAGSNGYVAIQDSSLKHNFTFSGNTTSLKASALASDLNSVSQLWQVSSSSHGKVSLKNANTGSYLKSATELSDTPTEWTILWRGDDSNIFTLSNGTTRLGISGNSLSLGAADSALTYSGVDSFIIPLDVIGDKTYGSAYLPFAVEVSGVKAYTKAVVSTSAQGDTITLSGVATTIPAYTPMILVGENADSIAATFTILDEADAPEATTDDTANLLRGTTIPMKWTSTLYLTFGKRNNMPCFYKTIMNNLPANRVYIETNGLSSTLYNILTVDDEKVTGINDATVDVSGTGSGVIYDLQGRRLNTARRGINIINGKKVIVK